MASFFGLDGVIVFKTVVSLSDVCDCSVNVRLHFVRKHLFCLFKKLTALTVVISLDFENSLTEILVKEADFLLRLEVQAFVLL